MQTFLPYASLTLSAKALDDSRLRKQQTEAEQILKTVHRGPFICDECGDGFSYGCCGGYGKPKATPWYNHPAVLQWVGYEECLVRYLNAIARECKNRGFKSRHEGFNEVVDIIHLLPPWFGKEEFHASHRSRLLFKGRVDAACSVLKPFLKVKSINQWLITNGYPSKNTFKMEDIIRLEKYATEICNLTIPENYYKKFNWEEPDNIPYVWPVKKETASV